MKEWTDEWMRMRPIMPGGKNIYIYTSKCTPHFIPVASLDWKSNWLAKTIHVMNYKDIGVFYWTQELGGTWISGKSYALGLERHKNSLSLSPLNSSCACFTLSLQIDFLSSSRPLVKYGHPEFASCNSNQTERPGPLGSNSKFLGEKILLAQLCLWFQFWSNELWPEDMLCSKNVGTKALHQRFWSQLSEKRETTGNLADTLQDINYNYLHKWGSAHFPLQMGFWENNKC